MVAAAGTAAAAAGIFSCFVVCVYVHGGGFVGDFCPTCVCVGTAVVVVCRCCVFGEPVLLEHADCVSPGRTGHGPQQDHSPHHQDDTGSGTCKRRNMSILIDWLILYRAI